MLNTFHYIYLFELADSSGHQRLVAILQQANELLGPQSLEVFLQLAEHQLDRVPLRAI